MNHFNLQNATTQAKEMSTSRKDPSVIELLNQQQTLHRDTMTVTSKLSELQTQYKMTIS